jgi:hypothetical protein
MAGDGLDEAAQAFDAAITGETKPAPRGKQTADGPPETLFKNLSTRDADTEPEGGGDNMSEEEAIYGKSKSEADTGDAGKGPRKDRESRPPKDPDDDDGDPDESDDADESESDEEEEQEADEESSALLKQQVEVTVDGEPQTVSVKEALEGYIRTETFHRRMNQLDEAKKIVRKAAADAVQNYEYSMGLAQQMQQYMETLVPKEPNWDEEFQKDPQKARELQRYYEKVKAFSGQVSGQMSEAQKRQMASNHAQLAAFAEEEGSKFEAMNRKNWTDPRKKAKDLTSMRKTGLTAGFTEEELSQVYDSRMLTVLLKASKYDRMMAARPRPVIRSAKPIPPGAGSARQRAAPKGLDSAMKKLNKTGSMEDAAAVFDNIIARG